MSANTPAKPVTGALSTWPIRVSGTAHLAFAGTLCRRWTTGVPTTAPPRRTRGCTRRASPSRRETSPRSPASRPGRGPRRRHRHRRRRAGRAGAMGATAVGVDPSEGMLDVARSARPGHRVPRRAGDRPAVHRRPVRRRARQLRAGALRQGRDGAVRHHARDAAGRRDRLHHLDRRPRRVHRHVARARVDGRARRSARSRPWTRRSRTTSASRAGPRSRRSCSTRGCGTSARSPSDTSGVTAVTSTSTA